MLTEPSIEHDKITHLLESQYSVEVDTLEFLPLGADINTAAYKVNSTGGKTYFLKLRLGNFEEVSVTIPKLLKDSGVSQIISPIPTITEELHTTLENFHTILYPFIDGQNAAQRRMSREEWHDFGKALKKIHTTPLPPQFENSLQKQTFSPKWRSALKKVIQEGVQKKYQDNTATKTAEFLKDKQGQVMSLIEMTEKSASALQGKKFEFVLCHSDIHAANMLVTEDGRVYIVDWDNPVLAPKERDLMYIGAGVGDVWSTNEEIEMFYEGYGRDEKDYNLITYFRLERIIEDIVLFTEEIHDLAQGEVDRERSLKFLKSNFEPDGVLDVAKRTELS